MSEDETGSSHLLPQSKAQKRVQVRCQQSGIWGHLVREKERIKRVGIFPN